MDQKPIVIYLPMKRMALDAVHDDLVRTLGEDAVAYSTVTKYARSAQVSGRKEATPPEAPDVERSPVDEAIFTALAEFPFLFSSVREFSRIIFRDPPCTGTSRNQLASPCVKKADFIGGLLSGQRSFHFPKKRKSEKNISGE
jgi:hypothetical protein